MLNINITCKLNYFKNMDLTNSKLDKLLNFINDKYEHYDTYKDNCQSLINTYIKYKILYLHLSKIINRCNDSKKYKLYQLIKVVRKIIYLYPKKTNFIDNYIFNKIKRCPQMT